MLLLIVMAKFLNSCKKFAIRGGLSSCDKIELFVLNNHKKSGRNRTKSY